MAHSGRQEDRAQEVPLSEVEGAKLEGWMRAGVINGFLERERAITLEAKWASTLMYGEVTLKMLIQVI